MNKLQIAFLSASLVAGASLAASTAPYGATTSKSDTAAQWSNDGLKPVSGSGLDVVYVRPDANLALYRKVLIKPVVVDFKRNWQRDLTTYSRIFPRAEDVERSPVNGLDHLLQSGVQHRTAPDNGLGFVDEEADGHCLDAEF